MDKLRKLVKLNFPLSSVWWNVVSVNIGYSVRSNHKNGGSMGIARIYPVRFSIIFFALLWLPVVSHAHHSFAPYDIRSPINIQGKVESFRYMQPHARLILVDTEGVSWDIEVPNRRWERQGLARDAIEAGDELTVRIFPARNGKPDAAISAFTKNGTYSVVMEQVRQQSGNEAADAIEAGEPVEQVLERYSLPE